MVFRTKEHCRHLLLNIMTICRPVFKNSYVCYHGYFLYTNIAADDIKSEVSISRQLAGFYLLGGRGEASPQTSQLPPSQTSQLSPKKVLLKKIATISNKDLFLTTILRRLLMSRNAISANPEHYIFKIFRGACPRTPLEGLKKSFLAAAWLKNFFQDPLPSPPPKQKS